MMDKRKWMIGVAAVWLIAVAAWALGFFQRTDPAVAELQELGAQMFDNSLSDEQRDALRGEFRQRMESLSDDQRRAFFEASRGQWMGRVERRMDEFFNLSAAEQQKRLDEMLNRMREPRTERRDAARGDRGRGNWGGMTEAQRDERSKRRLDQTSPKLRAQFTEFRRRLDERARQRGIDPGSLRGRGFPGRGRV